ncbi:MAG: alpha/beta fold hydrolase [Pseudomonadota bacterium]|nr:alpha/beta fold hydrolase [Pseudomonadota bacterium]
MASSPIREIQQKPLRKKLNRITSKQIFTSSNSQSIEIFETNVYKKKVIFFPGWLGHKDSKYLIPLADLLHINNFDIIRIHPIDHGDTEHLNKDFFRATDIQTLIEAVEFIGKKYQNNEIHLIGFSLGGNIALRISACESINFLKSTVVISPVIDPEISMRAMDNTSWILKKYFVNKWRRTLRRKMRLHNISNVEESLRYKDLEKMTEFFTKNFSPHKNVKELFAGYAITQDTINQIKNNTLIYSSVDDPCVPIKPLCSLDQTNNVKFKPQQYGGHCGFIDDFKFNSSVYEEIVNKLSDNES